MMGLKTVGTLTWDVCESCKSIDTCENPSLYQEGKSNKVSCADYLSNEESEE